MVKEKCEGLYHLLLLLLEIPDASFAAYIQQRFPFTTEFPLPLFRGRQLELDGTKKSGTGGRKSSLIWERGVRTFPSNLIIFGESAELFNNLECLVEIRV
ncbi:hypothetical protein CEXT_194791 [Caerostris extrusa]|uniref:Uncharacterized protein n=1 Tax=Caerostris extrusa TaxID=172846 RepID=A0AAV4MCS5_CAEEX|nr:hypothetical protein CEXT_194791 [Caerostris extrusa]